MDLLIYKYAISGRGGLLHPIVNNPVNTIVFKTCPLFSTVCLMASPRPPTKNRQRSSYIREAVRDMNLWIGLFLCEIRSFFFVVTFSFRKKQVKTVCDSTHEKLRSRHFDANLESRPLSDWLIVASTHTA